MPTDMQRRVHGIWDIFVQCRDTDRRNVLRESMRRLCCSHERRRGRLHQLNREWVDMPADVQLGVHCIWDIFLQPRGADRCDVLDDTLRGGSACEG